MTVAIWIALVLRDQHCVFPHCQCDARSCDLDHIVEYVPPDEGGPPGQTHPGNLAPLCRRHHRVKTAKLWHYQRHPDGTYTWTSPHGQQHLRTPTGTTALPAAAPKPAPTAGTAAVRTLTTTA